MLNFLPKIDTVEDALYCDSLFDDQLCYVYFVAFDGAVKIGRTTDISKRMQTIQTSCHGKIELLYCFLTDKFTENELHNLFSDLKLKGEWFLFNAKFVLRLEKYMKQYNSWWIQTKEWVDAGGEGLSPSRTVFLPT